MKRVAILITLVSGCLLGACESPESTTGMPRGGGAVEERNSPFLVVGIDGGEWRVIRKMWAEGRLPHLKALADRGVSTRLRTRYSASPVIWTTIATGMRPQDHGITDFVVPTPQGDVPVSSTVRRVPALWNMLTRAERRVGVLGWWASWPAEEVNGVVVSDRVLHQVPHRISPASFEDETLAALQAVRTADNPFTGNAAARERDLLMARLGERMVAEDYDLLLVYFRGVDIVSHNHWKHYEPESFPLNPPRKEAVEAFGDLIPREYEAVDEALGRLLSAARPEPNVLVISDHGFRPAAQEIVKVGLEFDSLLERLGYLERVPDSDRIDLARSRLFTHASPAYRALKWVRFGGENGLTTAAERTLRGALTADLHRITWNHGGPAFEVRDATPTETQQGADFAVEVQVEDDPTAELLLDGDPAPLSGLIREISHISGTHGENTHGIFLAAGPDIDPEGDIGGIRIHDITPTLLYGLGLPVAENFAGRVRVDLFHRSFQRDHPVETIASWGPARDGGVSTSEVDQDLMRELRALGYLD